MYNYFIHPSNLQKMDNVLKMRMSEGSSGYGIYMMLLELLRDSDNYQTKYDPTVLAWSMHESDIAKVKAVCELYDLFEVSPEGQLSCPWLTSVMSQHEDKKRKLSEAGKKSAELRKSSANNAATTLSAPPQGGSNEVGNLSQQTKPNKSNDKKNPPITPQVESGEDVDIFSDEYISQVGKAKTELFNPDLHALGLVNDLEHNYNPMIAAAVTYNLTADQFNTLVVATDSCKIGGARFVAFLACIRHCRQTQFTPQYPFEYFMSRIKNAQDA